MICGTNGLFTRVGAYPYNDAAMIQEYVFDRSGLATSPQFRERLARVISPYYRSLVLREQTVPR